MVTAPAKLNLALFVGPRRPDGFHEIASVMVPVTLADRVTVERTPGAELEVVCAVAPGEQNLAAKLVRELETRLERTFEVRVTIAKQIPQGGGLGGGSSDAAAALVALERLFDLDLSQRVRYEVAATVGSDVPFFLWPGAQLAMGRGQVLKPVDLPPLHLVIAMPELALSTAAVYRWYDEGIPREAGGGAGSSAGSSAGKGAAKSAGRAVPGAAGRHLAAFADRARRLSSEVQAAGTAVDLAALVHNDLEIGVVARRPQVGALRDSLRAQGAQVAAMTGSGAAVFGVFAGEGAAVKARAALAPARAWYVTDLQPGASPRPAGPRGRRRG